MPLVQARRHRGTKARREGRGIRDERIHSCLDSFPLTSCLRAFVPQCLASLDHRACRRSPRVGSSTPGSIILICSASSIIHCGGSPARDAQIRRPRLHGPLITGHWQLRLARVDVEAFPHDPRRPRPQLRRLDPPQDQLGVGLADGEGTHSSCYRPTRRPAFGVSYHPDGCILPRRQKMRLVRPFRQ